MPMTEDMVQRPINPYGDSKLMVEHILKDVAKAWRVSPLRPRVTSMSPAVPRTPPSVRDHKPETHIIPVLLQVALGKRSHMDLFGTDYPTKDGTCVKSDYIHVWDPRRSSSPCSLESLKPGQGLFYNLGVGRGYSNREIIEAVRRVTGHPIPVKEGPRRPGDPAELYADPSKIKKELGWSVRFTDLDEIVKTAWNWFKTHPNGY